MDINGEETANPYMGNWNVSVVITTYNRSTWLHRCLESLKAQATFPSEVIVVGRPEDKVSQKLVSKVADEWNRLVWAEAVDTGYLDPVRVGLHKASGSLVAFLDDDVEAAPDWLTLVSESFKDPRVACVGGREIVEQTDKRPRKKPGRIRWFGRYMGGLGQLSDGDSHFVDGLVECNWMWRASILRKLKWDEIFNIGDSLHYGLDLCLQVKALGMEVVYLPAARVVHHRAPRASGPSRSDSAERARTHGRNLTYIALKHFSRKRQVLFFMWWICVGERQCYGILTAIWDFWRAPRMTLERFRSGLKGRMEGVRRWRESEKQILPRRSFPA